MADEGARALWRSAPLAEVPLLNPLARAADALRFVASPTPWPVRPRWSRALVAALVTVFALDLALDWLSWRAIEAADAAHAFLPEPLGGTQTPGEELFWALLIAPLLEEAVYRGWMSGRVAALRFALFGFAAEACFIAGLWMSEEAAYLLGVLGAGIAMAGFVQWLATRERDTRVPAWFTRHFALLVWASSLFFAAIHLGNYGPLESPLGVLVVTPQLIGGLLLAYVRTRLGLRAAMAYHAGYNALYLALE